MNEMTAKRNRLLAQKVLKGLQSRNMTGYYAETKEEALKLAGTFMGMIKGETTEEEIEVLDEAAALQDISHMPARVKCAVLGWRTMKQMVEELNRQEVKDADVTAAGSSECGAGPCGVR